MSFLDYATEKVNPKPKRVWKPIDVGGLRLYRVVGRWGTAPVNYVVAALSPSNAVSRVIRCYHGCPGELTLRGEALNVLQPAHWWESGVPCFHEPDRWKKEEWEYKPPAPGPKRILEATLEAFAEHHEHQTTATP